MEQKVGGKLAKTPFTHLNRPYENRKKKENNKKMCYDSKDRTESKLMVKHSRTLGDILVRDNCTLTSMFCAVLE